MNAKFLACLAIVAVGITASGQGSLTIGDPVPAFKPEGWVKGTPVKEFEKGKVYVVEFWATWCGPCIAAFPHLSDLADKYKGKVEVISVNTWDRSDAAEKVALNQAHVERVKKFVAENDAKMRYNIALDDEKDTISTSWMRAAGQNGIPCAFIIDQESEIAWIGHPMQMDAPLEKIYSKTYDKAAFKKTFDEQAAKAKVTQKLNADITAAAKAGDRVKFDELVAKLEGPPPMVKMQAVSLAGAGDPAFALAYAEPLVGKVDGMPADMWCSLLGYIVREGKTDDVRQRALVLSASQAEKADAKVQAAALGLHARSLGWAGKKDEARAYIDKAKAALSSYEPESARAGISKFLDSVLSSLAN